MSQGYAHCSNGYFNRVYSDLVDFMGWENLANAIVEQAADDYVYARRKIERYKVFFERRWWKTERPSDICKTDMRYFKDYSRHITRKVDQNPKRMLIRWKEYCESDFKLQKRKIRDIRKFFRSGWYAQLTSLDGVQLLKDIDEKFDFNYYNLQQEAHMKNGTANSA